jgi:hypothetical protein
MDGGVRQVEMAELIKSEVRENAYRRRGERASHISSEGFSVTEPVTGDLKGLPHNLPVDRPTPKSDRSKAAPTDFHTDETQPYSNISPLVSHRGIGCTLTGVDARTIERSDTVLLMFLLDTLFPFLFPFYRPSTLQGGKSWVLELIISSPVYRQAALCQSHYFFSVVRKSNEQNVCWEFVIKQTRAAFDILRQALQVINTSNITDHLSGAARIMASIMQVQRFEIAVLSFNNCQSHLNASLALFRQILDSTGAVALMGPKASFNTAIDNLGLPSSLLHGASVGVPTAEQAAFVFSSALLIFDDIIASIVLQEQPRLYGYHHSLLTDSDGSGAPINLEAVIGCQNWALIQIGEIAALDAWKQRCKKAGNLDVMVLAHRATAIKNSLDIHLTRLEREPAIIATKESMLLDVFAPNHSQQPEVDLSQSRLVTRVWAHAALLYLYIVVSGWQPASFDVRYHVDQIIELLTSQILPPALLRTMVWPFCVAGCLAEPVQEARFRGMTESLQPPTIFGTVRKALEIMEHVWQRRDTGDGASRDFAMCFRSQGDLVLLI